jgi:pimeloyl-ACP methyl ester carboxylesterase
MITDGLVDFKGYQIWYRVAKPEIESKANIPLLLLHGGPGGSSDIFEPLDSLSEYGMTVIRFDQLGCGRSDRPRDASLWTISNHLEQIETIREALGLEKIHLLGHSWGGMLALEYLLTKPNGVQKLILSSSVISTKLWVDEAWRLRLQMPSHIAKSLERCEKSIKPYSPPQAGANPAKTLTDEDINKQAKTMSNAFPIISSSFAARVASWLSYIPALQSAAYEILGIQFVIRHVCRLKPMPFGIFRMLAGSNGEIYQTLWGPSEFFANGLLKDWDIQPRLKEIKIPTLIISGFYDEATPKQMSILKEGIINSEQVLLQESAHCGMWEEAEGYRNAILNFAQAKH